MIGTNNNQNLSKTQRIYRWVKIISGTVAIIGGLTSGLYGLYKWHQDNFISVQEFQNYKEARQRALSDLREELDGEATQTRKAVVRLARAWYKTQIDEIQTDISALERKRNNSGLSEFEQSALIKARNRLNELQQQLNELPNETIID